jgi:hypothetical protein
MAPAVAAETVTPTTAFRKVMGPASTPIGTVVTTSDGTLMGVTIGNWQMLKMDGKVETIPHEHYIAPNAKPPKGLVVPPQTLFAGYAANIGADPEIFVLGKDGVVLPAFEYLPSKSDRKDHNPFWDGFQAEFTTIPIGCHGFVTDYVREGLQKTILAAKTKDPDAKLTIDSVVPIPLELRQRVDPEHLQLGCAPSKNVYGERRLAVPAPEELEIRFAGAHMHFGSSSMTESVLDRTVRLLDAVAGVAMVAFGEGYNCPDRRRFYGRAGEYRYHPPASTRCPPEMYKPFASDSRFEYRVPDTVLLAHPATYNLMLDFVRVVWRMGVAGLEFLWDADEDLVRRTINEYDVKSARQILEHNRPMLVRILEKSNPHWETNDSVWVEASLKAFFWGIGEVVDDPRDVWGNWWLDRPLKDYNEMKSTTCDGVTVWSDEAWMQESYNRKPSNWPYGRIWSSAAPKIVAGERV